MARRRTARWCSDRCRLRAWRHTARAADDAEIKRLRQQVAALREALQKVQNDGACAIAGCQLARDIAECSTTPAPPAPWRDEDWDSTAVRALRTKLTQARAGSRASS